MKTETTIELTHVVDSNETQFIAFDIETDGVYHGFLLGMQAALNFANDILNVVEKAPAEMKARAERLQREQFIFGEKKTEGGSN